MSEATNSEDPADYNIAPLKDFKMLMTSKDEIDYLMQKFNIEDSRDLFSWGIKMLYDLAKLDEAGYPINIIKTEIKDGKIHYNEKYIPIVFRIRDLAPTDQAYRRLPTPEMAEKICKSNE